MKKVSVIIPTYKNRGGLVRSINSVLSQTYFDLEVIVVDDNMPESEERRETEELMAIFKEEPRVNYLKHERNKNGAAARNTGIRFSKGDFIAFLDDDDSFLPSKIRKQIDFLNDHKEYDGVYCYSGRNGKRYGTTSYEGNAMKPMLMLETCMYTPTLLFRRDALLTINGFDEAFRRHQDYDLLLRFFAAGYKIGCVPEILCEIGPNKGENALTGEKLENTKVYFFEKFQSYIDIINKQEPGFKNKVYAKHYAGVFLTHVKTRKFKMALMVFLKFFFRAPWVFCGVINSSIKQHLKGIE